MMTTIDYKKLIDRISKEPSSEFKALVNAINTLDDDAKVWLHERIEWPEV